MKLDEKLIQSITTAGQEHILNHWDSLDESDQQAFSTQLSAIDFNQVDRLINTWILNEHSGEYFDSITPANVLAPVVDTWESDSAQAAKQAGEDALRAGRVGLVLVAGGQGTRLGYHGPKGAFPIGPVSGRSLFAFHAEKIHGIQRRYGCVLPWYIMVGESNEVATKEFFAEQNFFGLNPDDVVFFKQRMMPCVDEQGKYILNSPSSLAMNPNGHGGCIPALIENGIMDDARKRGIDTFSYFQVDNWATRLADPYFIGYHILKNCELSSKVNRKESLRDPAGVFCTCDGKLRVIEYTELDIFPQLLDVDADGNMVHFASNAAIHVISLDFIQAVYDKYEQFPWHCSHKKIPYINEKGDLITPDGLNGYKFETFIFDALEYAEGENIVLEIPKAGETTPTKQMTGHGSVEEARNDMSRFWGAWVNAAGCTRDLTNVVVEISPQFALDEEELVERTQGYEWPAEGPIAIGPEGEFIPTAD